MLNLTECLLLCVQATATDNYSCSLDLFGGSGVGEYVPVDRDRSRTGFLHLCCCLCLLFCRRFWSDSQYSVLRNFPNSRPWCLHRHLCSCNVEQQRHRHIQLPLDKQRIWSARSIWSFCCGNSSCMDLCVPQSPWNKRTSTGDYLWVFCHGPQEGKRCWGWLLGCRASLWRCTVSLCSPQRWLSPLSLWPYDCLTNSQHQSHAKVRGVNEGTWVRRSICEVDFFVELEKCCMGRWYRLV